MKHVMLYAKLHRVTVTGNNLNYEGSCAIDEELLVASGIYPFEKIEIYNINTGERFETYTIVAKPSSGVVELNGAAARKAEKGDILIICNYVLMDKEEIKSHIPNIVHVDRHNAIQKKGRNS